MEKHPPQTYETTSTTKTTTTTATKTAAATALTAWTTMPCRADDEDRPRAVGVVSVACRAAPEPQDASRDPARRLAARPGVAINKKGRVGRRGPGAWVFSGLGRPGAGVRDWQALSPSKAGRAPIDQYRCIQGLQHCSPFQNHLVVSTLTSHFLGSSCPSIIRFLRSRRPRRHSDMEARRSAVI